MYILVADMELWVFCQVTLPDLHVPQRFPGFPSENLERAGTRH